ncbi:MAG: hypothetical protein KDA41_20850, partial [Planctomycetales bacterium]|nr:hypothetical protein [Planctomycetales bacterium]
MKLLSLEDCFELFFETPSAATFASVRERVLEDDGYQPDWEKLHEVTRLVQQRRRRQAIEAVDALMPAWGLCPRLHYLAGLAAEQAGDWEEVELRRFLMQACLDGL